jgi:5-methylcytosine-specific restriction endonuclease McrA
LRVLSGPESIFNLPFEVEHIIPRSKEGGDDESNWALACRSCNLHKSDLLECPDSVTGLVVRLFDPRQDAWDDHFRIDLESGTSWV